jgi:hypothetical protein
VFNWTVLGKRQKKSRERLQRLTLKRLTALFFIVIKMNGLVVSCFNPPTTTSFRGPLSLRFRLLSVQLAIAESANFVKPPGVPSVLLFP